MPFINFSITWELMEAYSDQWKPTFIFKVSNSKKNFLSAAQAKIFF